MKAVLTGDIVNSRAFMGWQDDLTEVLNRYGSSPKNWEIFRGDSFQLIVDATYQVCNKI